MREERPYVTGPKTSRNILVTKCMSHQQVLLRTEEIRMWTRPSSRTISSAVTTSNSKHTASAETVEHLEAFSTGTNRPVLRRGFAAIELKISSRSACSASGDCCTFPPIPHSVTNGDWVGERG